MATLTKMDMIKALVEANKVDELKKEKDDSIKLAARMFRTLTNEKVKELYAERIQTSPEDVVEEITKKVEKVASKKTSKKAEKVEKVEEVKAEEKDPMYLPAKDEFGHEYKKAWVLDELNARGFSKLSNKELDFRKLNGTNYRLIYSRIDNNLIAKNIKTGKIERKTLCICPFIVKAFMDKYLK